MIKKLVRFVSVSIVAATMVACGGGGGNSGGTAPLPIVGGEGGDDTTQNPPQNPTPPPVPTPATGLDRLLGTVTFAYGFTGTTTVFTTRTTFSNASYAVSPAGATILRTDDTDRSMVCGTLENPIYEFLCILVRSTDGTGQITSQNIFLFNMTSATEGEGLFEFCSDDELVGDACVNALFSQPDGPLAVGISQQLAKATGASSVNGLAVTDAESDVFHAAVEAEFGSTPSAGSSTITGGDELKLAYQALMDQLN